jgi:hypothetical protein
MINERRAILVLIDARRITVAEAERLIAAWEDAREWFWIAVACAAVYLLQSHPHITLEGLASLLHTFVDHGTKLLHNTASFGLKKVGGIV